MNGEISVVLIGASVGLITAVITSWLNKKVFRDELAETQIIEVQIKNYQMLWEDISRINHEAIQLLSWMGSQVHQMQQEGTEQKKVLSRINIEYEPKSVDILKSIISLKKYFILLPAPLIESLKQYETLIWKIFKEQNFDKVNELIDVSENLFNSIRTNTATMIERKVKVSESISNLPKEGFIPGYIKDSFKK